MGRQAAPRLPNMDHKPCENAACKRAGRNEMVAARRAVPGEDEVELDGAQRRWWCSGTGSGGYRNCALQAQKAGAELLDAKDRRWIVAPT